jgi:hypothetical protein
MVKYPIPRRRFIYEFCAILRGAGNFFRFKAKKAPAGLELCVAKTMAGALQGQSKEKS